MKYILFIIFSFQCLACSAQVFSNHNNAIPVPKNKITLDQNFNGSPTLVWREIKMRESNHITDLANRLITETKEGLQVFHNPKDTIRQVQMTTLNQVIFTELYPDTTDRILILEEWDYNKDKGKMVVSILAIAPAYIGDGKYYPLFWIKYPHLISILKSMEIPIDHNQSRTMYEVFEKRLFTSDIIKYRNEIN